jgi:hypothetical protein
VERLFSELTQRQLRRLTVHKVDELNQAISDYLDRRSQDPKPVVWTASVNRSSSKLRKRNRL